jgi:PRTRC genetic system ThiF family protein
MTITHRIHPHLLEHAVALHLVGCGGNGSQMLTGLARLHVALTTLGHPGFEVCVWDPDEVSRANVGRQLFSASDVGQNKAKVLVHRVNAFYGLAWAAAPALFNAGGTELDIVVSCVDSAAARRDIDRMVKGVEHLFYWMDLGNRAEDGQVVLGCPVWNDEHRERYPERLPTVLELFPELMNKRLKEDTAPSCSLAEALERQHLFVNQAVVTSALQILWQLFRFGAITWHGAFVNLKTGRTTPLPVDLETWARMKGSR